MKFGCVVPAFPTGPIALPALFRSQSGLNKSTGLMGFEPKTFWPAVWSTELGLLGWAGQNWGLWRSVEATDSTAALQLQAGHFAEQSFAKDKSDIHARLLTDSTTIYVYIYKMLMQVGKQRNYLYRISAFNRSYFLATLLKAGLGYSQSAWKDLLCWVTGISKG